MALGGGEELFDLVHRALAPHFESAFFAVDHLAGFVKEQSVGDDLEIEGLAESVLGIDEGDVGCFSPVVERFGIGDATGIEGDSDENEFFVGAKFSKGLPPGQLGAATSPRGPVKEDEFLARVLAESDRVALHVREGDVRKHGGGLLLGGCGLQGKRGGQSRNHGLMIANAIFKEKVQAIAFF